MEIQKASFRYFVTAYIQSKKRNQQRRFPCNVLRDLKQNFIREKSQKTKIRTSYEIGNLPIRRTYTCVDCVSHISVSSVSLAVEILRKNDKASQVKCRQRPASRLPLRRHFHRKTDVWVRGRSKTILIGLGIFGCGGEKSVHGRPSSELAPYDCSSQNTEDFAAWCKLISKECRFNDRAGECGVVRFTTQFFILYKAKALPPY